MLHKFFKVLVITLGLLIQIPGHTEDIDLFVGVPPSTTDIPNVLIVVDNTANWNSAFTNEIAALVSVFNSLPADKFKVGIMLASETGGGNSNVDGGYVRAAIRLMDAGNKAKYAAMINGFDVGNDKGNGGKQAKVFAEAYLYFKGLAPEGGNNKTKTDYTGNISGSAADKAVYALAGNALTSKAGATYQSPVVSASCAKNYIIYISNGAASDNASDTTRATAMLASAGGSTTQLNLSPSGSQDNVMDEWSQFAKKSDLGITTYTIDINKVTTGQGPGWTELLKSVAAQSGGKYASVQSTGTQIIDAINNALSEIQPVDSVFASVSLPVSVNTQGTFLNQVYVGMFRPDEFRNPRWTGNLKQYKFGLDSASSIQLQDADGVSAINTGTGFITKCARSYWTPTTVDTLWAQIPRGSCIGIIDSQKSNYPDGNVVEKGAQAYQLRGSSTRTVYTCSASIASCTTLTTFDNTTVSQTQLGAADTTERDALVNWAIGQDNKSDENADGVYTDRRLSAHGDIVHSRPVALNFGTAGAPNVVVFYGGNDGLLRAINGNQTNPIGTVPAGGELWSFMAPEFYPSIKRLRDNTGKVSFPNAATGSPKSYGVDGPITAYKSAAVAYVYSTMRRGGRTVTAFDVTIPTAPTLKWKKGCPPPAADDTGCTTGFSGIGQTWSSLKSFAASGYGSGATPMLIMGGGYDTCDDYDALASGGANHNCTASSKGHYVYVLDANTGAIVQTLDTGGTRGVIADVTLVRDASGQAVYGYTADLGGNVYRISFGSGTVSANSSSTWTITKIASLGCDTTAACTANRKFSFAPSVVAVTGGYAIMLGSGDREKPLTYYAAATAVANRFFMFTDKPSTSAATWPGSTDCGTAIICMNSLFAITDTSTPTAADLAGKKGWYLGLTASEQVVTSAVTIFDVVSFSTHQPAIPVTGSCKSNLGNSRVYNIGYTNAAGTSGGDRFADLVGDGLPPSPVAGMVNVNGSLKPFCVGCSPDSPLQVTSPSGGGTVVQPKARTHWYLEK